jgi:ADP-ribose pyrophosphatase
MTGLASIENQPMRKREFPGWPRAGVGAVVVRNGQILLVKRAKPPSAECWALPGGSVELGESLAQAAEREVLEETGVVVRAGPVVHAFDVIDRAPDGAVRHHFVVVDLVADYVSGEPRAASDALAARWVPLAEVRGSEVSPETQRLVDRLRERRPG